MTRYLTAVDTVHDAATVCDYLVDRVDSDDTVLVGSGIDHEHRDVEDALNVFLARLPGVSVEPVPETGSADATILDHARTANADVIVAVRDGPSTSLETDPLSESVLARADRPVVLLPGD